MASVAAAMQEKRGAGDRFGPECLSPDVHIPGREKDRGDVPVTRSRTCPTKPDLVVVGQRHLARGMRRLEALLERKMRLLARFPELLKDFFYSRQAFGGWLRGTHGKTTTTSLLTWVFRTQRG